LVVFQIANFSLHRLDLPLCQIQAHELDLAKREKSVRSVRSVRSVSYVCPFISLHRILLVYFAPLNII
jgi:hypothetical protein